MSSTIGTLQAHIILDRPNNTHWGTDDPVQGKVVLVLNADHRRELFGPLILKLTFRARTVQAYTSGNFKYKEQRGLFTLHHSIHDGPFRFTPGKKAVFPFTLNFPAKTSLTRPDPSGLPGYAYHSDPDQPLPPSFDMWGRGLNVTTEYRLGINGGMPGISVNFNGLPSATGPLIKFDCSRLEPSNLSRKTSKWTEEIRIPEWQFLPTPERPNILRRLADSLSSREQDSDFRFEMLATVPLDLYIGDPAVVTFQVQLPTHEDPPNHANELDRNSRVPKITMTLPSIKVWAETRATFTRTFIKSKPLLYNMTSFDLERTLRAISLDVNTDFAQTSYTKTVTTGKLDVRPSSFDTGVLGRAYTLQIEYTVHVAGKEVKMKKSFDVKIHPPPKAEAAIVRASGLRSSSLPRYESSTVPPYREAGDDMPGPSRVETAA